MDDLDADTWILHHNRWLRHWWLKSGEPLSPEGSRTCNIHTGGIRIPIRLGYMDEFENISVGDKGKASSIAKVLVAIQTLWFCTQLVAHLTQFLPISLLELNTFAHSICTLFVIYFWWEKPQDIEQPTLLPLNHIQPLCAFLWIHSKLNENRLAYGKSRTFFSFFSNTTASQRPSSGYLWLTRVARKVQGSQQEENVPWLFQTWCSKSMLIPAAM